MDTGNTRDAGSKVTAYAVIDADGQQHSLWFLECEAKNDARGVGGTVVRLGEVSEAVRPVEHTAGRADFLLAGFEMIVGGHTPPREVLAAARKNTGTEEGRAELLRRKT